jgi:hypothetical protein
VRLWPRKRKQEQEQKPPPAPPPPRELPKLPQGGEQLRKAFLAKLESRSEEQE